jgi:hypothetical protein
MFKRNTFAVIAFLLSMFAPLVAIAGDSFKVSATLSHNGVVFASPVLVVKDRALASVVVAGENGYKLALTVSDIGDGKLNIKTDLDSSHGSISPTLVIQPGELSSIRIGDLSISLKAVRGEI